MILSATGHRPNKLGGYSAYALDKLRAIAYKKIEELKPEKVISGMALGWDTAVAIAALQLGIPLIAAVPFRGQECKWYPESVRMYNNILKKAESIVYVSEGTYAAWKMQTRNEYMVNNSDVILAMYDGSSGGTRNCIEYAKKQNKQIINLYSELK